MILDIELFDAFCLGLISTCIVCLSLPIMEIFSVFPSLFCMSVSWARATPQRLPAILD